MKKTVNSTVPANEVSADYEFPALVGYFSVDPCNGVPYDALNPVYEYRGYRMFYEDRFTVCDGKTEKPLLEIAKLKMSLCDPALTSLDEAMEFINDCLDLTRGEFWRKYRLKQAEFLAGDAAYRHEFKAEMIPADEVEALRK